MPDGANLTNFLVTNTVSGTLSSIEQAVRENVAVCIAEDRVAELLLQHPKVRVAPDPAEAGGESWDGVSVPQGIKDPAMVFEYMDQGVCAAVVAPLNELQSYQSQQTHCEKMAVGATVMAVPTGMAVQWGERGVAIKQTLGRLVEQGVFKQLVEKNTPTSQCPSLGVAASASLDIDDMGGTFLFSTLFVALGVLVSLVERVLPKYRTAEGRAALRRNLAAGLTADVPTARADEKPAHSSDA